MVGVLGFFTGVTAIQPQDPVLATINVELDATLSEDTEYHVTVTEHPIEDGSVIADHVRAATMLMTDGVAEAQNAEGHLFGFERIAEMLRKGVAAVALATAAQEFGQEDDITVLTVARMTAA